MDNYRGITLSVVFSKLFEMCVLKMYRAFLVISDLQYDFKTGLGCNDTILSARMPVNFLTDRGSTATMCALNLSKAFDKVDHYGLFLKVMPKNVPRKFIIVLLSWYAKCNVAVRWCDSLSNSFLLQVGVRQGGVL
jgi:hypothetical protein